MGEFDQQKYEHALKKPRILKPVEQSLFTFTATDISYFIVTEMLNKVLVEVRTGKVTMEKPKVLRPYELANVYFEGFDADHLKYIELMLKKSGAKGLEYKYKNEPGNVDLISGNINNVLGRISEDVKGDTHRRTAVIKGVLDMWGISLMKCVMETIMHSFPGNVKEFEERGWFS